MMSEHLAQWLGLAVEHQIDWNLYYRSEAPMSARYELRAFTQDGRLVVQGATPSSVARDACERLQDRLLTVA